MMTARARALALALLLTLTACGASAGPAPAGDAGSDGACAADELMLSGRCVPASNAACGDPPVACPSGQSCALVGAGGAPMLRCMAN